MEDSIIFLDEDNWNDLDEIDGIDNMVLSNKADKINLIDGLKKYEFEKIIPLNIEVNNYYHIISNGSFDFFTIVKVLLDRLGTCNEFYSST